MLVGVIIALIAAILVGNDASKRGMNSIGWGLGVFLLLIVFLPLYFILRKPKIETRNPSSSRFEDLYNFDFPALLEKATFIGEWVSPYDDKPIKTILYDYECRLNPPFLNAFDSMIMRLRSKGIGIEPDRHITIILKSKNRTLTNPQISVVVDAVCEAWKKDPAANPELASVYMFKDGRVDSLSFDQDESLISLKRDVPGGLIVQFQIIYEDMKRLGQEFLNT